MAIFHFALTELPPEAESLRAEVREFVRETVGDGAPNHRARTWGGFDPEFSRKLGARGWIGMTWPKQYGGHEPTFLERYVVLEELLAAGAPVSAHWIADRQSGPPGTHGDRARRRRAVGRPYCAIGATVSMTRRSSRPDLRPPRQPARKVSTSV